MTKPNWNIRQLTYSDLSYAMDLCIQSGWRDSIADWERMLDWQPSGCFGAELDKKIVGTVTTIRYGIDLAWIGYLLVDLDYRRRGLGRSLMLTAMRDISHHGVKCVMLDASQIGQSLYKKLGFRSLFMINTWTGTAKIPGVEQPYLTEELLDEVALFDRKYFGANRSRVIFKYFREFPELSRADIDNNEVRGYLLGYHRGDVIAIGPWMHETPKGATSLLSSLLKSTGGKQLLVRVPEANKSVSELLRKCGLSQRSTYTRMVLGNIKQPIDHQKVFAIAGLAKG